jgi:hypothetical protein
MRRRCRWDCSAAGREHGLGCPARDEQGADLYGDSRQLPVRLAARPVVRLRGRRRWTIGYAVGPMDSYLAGRGSTTLRVYGYLVGIDASRLAPLYFRVSDPSTGNGVSIDTDRFHCISLLPGTYEFASDSRSGSSSKVRESSHMTGCSSRRSAGTARSDCTSSPTQRPCRSHPDDSASSPQPRIHAEAEANVRSGFVVGVGASGTARRRDRRRGCCARTRARPGRGGVP